jgi:hypothetical protein
MYKRNSGRALVFTALNNCVSPLTASQVHKLLPSYSLKSTIRPAMTSIKTKYKKATSVKTGREQALQIRISKRIMKNSLSADLDQKAVLAVLDATPRGLKYESILVGLLANKTSIEHCLIDLLDRLKVLKVIEVTGEGRVLRVSDNVPSNKGALSKRPNVPRKAVPIVRDIVLSEQPNGSLYGTFVLDNSRVSLQVYPAKGKAVCNLKVEKLNAK